MSSFLKKLPTDFKVIKDDMFTPDSDLKNTARVDDITPETVEYYFDVRADKEIPKEITDTLL